MSSGDPAATEIPVKVGDVLADKYRVERILGLGGMGVVLEAQHVTLHHKVALKLMLPAAAAEPDAVERFLREARAAAQLRSEHVARVLDVGTIAEGEPFMVMELLDGRGLDEILREQGPVPIEDAVAYVRQACDALSEAHERGIVHRDLKPANLFVAKDARGQSAIKVLDFGISKHTAATGDLALTKTTTVMGSPLYMSPEQMRATRDVDLRTDVWSLGVTLHELLTGRVPFYSDSPMELGAKVLYEEPASLEGARSDVPPVLGDVVRRCLEKDPAKRFASARALADALREAMESAQASHRSTLVRVTNVSGAAASALPFSHTAIAHARTAGEGPSAPRRSIVFGAIAVVAVGTIVMVVRTRMSPPAAGEAEARDAFAASAPAASFVATSPSVSVAVSAPPPASAPLTPEAPVAQPVATAAVSALPRGRPAPHSHRAPRAADSALPTPSASAPAPPTPAPSATPSTNPLDHM